MEHLSNDHKDHPNQLENSHKLWDEMEHPVVNQFESQQKVRQQHDQNNKNILTKNQVLHITEGF